MVCGYPPRFKHFLSASRRLLVVLENEGGFPAKLCLRPKGALDVPLLDRYEYQLFLRSKGVSPYHCFGSLRVMLLPMRVYVPGNDERRLRLQNKRVEAV